MKKAVILVTLLLGACSSGQYRDTNAEIKTVPIEVEPYLGKWYEIARYPNWFEKECTNVTAEYALRDDEKISVKNSCTRDGKVDVANGVARIEGEGKLGVTFTPWLPFLWGDYWIMGRKDYDIAVIGNPGGSSGWILAREPKISTQDRQWAESVFTDNGYSLEALESVTQE